MDSDPSILSTARVAELVSLAEAVLNTLCASLPPDLQEASAECPAILLNMNQWAAEQGEPADPELMGLFTGMSRAEGTPGSPQEAPALYLFVDNLWEFSGRDREEFRREVEITYLHELGHYLGLDEDGVALRGLA